MAIVKDIQNHIKSALLKSQAALAYKDDPVLWQAFYAGFQRRFCWSSNSLEGNTLSLDETIAVIDFDEARGP